MVKIADEIIEEKTFTKYLGILIDKNLSWKQHIHYINLKISKGIGILAKMRHFISKSQLRSLYFAFIQPHIKYGLINWGCSATTNLNPIRKSMNKAIRIMGFKKYNDPVIPLFNNFSILNFDNNKKLIINKFMWKLNNNKLPHVMEKMFIKRQAFHTTGNGIEEEFAIPTINTEYKRRFISYTGVKLWRGIPRDIRDKPTIGQFQYYFMEYLFLNQYVLTVLVKL